MQPATVTQEGHTARQGNKDMPHGRTTTHSAQPHHACTSPAPPSLFPRRSHARAYRALPPLPPQLHERNSSRGRVRRVAAACSRRQSRRPDFRRLTSAFSSCRSMLTRSKSTLHWYHALCRFKRFCSCALLPALLATLQILGPRYHYDAAPSVEWQRAHKQAQARNQPARRHQNNAPCRSVKVPLDGVSL